MVECWFIPLVFVAVSLAIGLRNWFYRAAETRGRRRYEAGQCVHCGYDLRESPTRCPECGADTFKQARSYWIGRERRP